MHEEIKGPVWGNGCDHPADTYVCSFKSWYAANKSEVIDLYVYPDSVDGQHACLRYGNELGEYYSPGCLRHIISASSQLARYRAAVEMLSSKGYFKWEMKGDKA